MRERYLQHHPYPRRTQQIIGTRLYYTLWRTWASSILSSWVITAAVVHQQLFPPPLLRDVADFAVQE